MLATEDKILERVPGQKSLIPLNLKFNYNKALVYYKKKYVYIPHLPPLKFWAIFWPEKIQTGKMRI